MIGDEIHCLRNVGPVQLRKANSYCQSLNANQILPTSRQESDDLVSALLSLKLSSEDGKKLVSIGIYKTKKGEWYDFTGQLISYFNWLPGEPDDIRGNLNYAKLRTDEVNGTAGWADYSGSDKSNIICTKIAGHGKNNSLLLLD